MPVVPNAGSAREAEYVRAPTKACTGSFVSRNGIPCSHVLYDKLVYGEGVLEVEDFVPHWLLLEDGYFARDWISDYFVSEESGVGN